VLNNHRASDTKASPKNENSNTGNSMREIMQGVIEVMRKEVEQLTVITQKASEFQSFKDNKTTH